MGGPRRKSRLVARRRTDDEGEDDASLIAADDSLSEPSVPSDIDDDADGEGSETSEVGTPSKAQNGQAILSDPALGNGSATATKVPNSLKEPHVMMNTLTIADGSGEPVDEIAIDDVHGRVQPTVNLPPSVGSNNNSAKNESAIERRKREHEEYKKRRDADPAFVPNRGEFFMHDQRNGDQDAQTQNGYRPAIRGRGRGRGGGASMGGPSIGGPQRPQPDDGPWVHDLHQSVVGPEPQRPEPSQTAADTVPDHRPRPAPRSNEPPPNRDFSSTTATGVVNCQILMPGMTAPISFNSVPQNLHVRLPHHRPPLRRDKPVRVSLPDRAPSYIFPAEYRSFIFIPRALRPNQQGFGRPRGRASLGGPGGLRSGRNSMYGGSVYSPSIAMSRRSSFARDRDGMASPAMSVMSRVTGPVRAPPNAQSMMQPHMYKHGPSAGYVHVPMHQPRPTKSIPMPEVESPGLYGPSGQQPFANQVPPQYVGDYRPDSRRTSYPSQHGTPLGQIPERAIHAQPFQPPMQGHHPQAMMPGQGYPPPGPPQMYYPQQPYQQQAYGYYYPPQPVPAQQYGYAPPPPPPAPPQQDANGQISTVAHESGGTVYYYDQSQMAADTAMAYQGGMMPYGVQQPYMPPPQGPVYYPQQ